MSRRAERKLNRSLEKVAKKCHKYLNENHNTSNVDHYVMDVLFEGVKYDTFIFEGVDSFGRKVCSVNFKLFSGGKWELIPNV